MGSVDAERQKPVQRIDNFLAVAGNGSAEVIAGTGRVLVSANKSQKWLRQQLPAPASIVGIATCKDRTFVALDFYSKVWLGSADGHKWDSRPIPTDFNPVAITCDDNGGFWVVGSRTNVLSSSDRGQTWKRSNLHKDAILTSVQFTDASHGFVTGEFGTIAASVDGGQTWKELPALPNEFYPFSTLFMDGMHAWSTGLGGVTLYTENGGLSWSRQSTPTPRQVYALAPIGGKVIGVGAGGQIVSFDATSWSPIPASPDLHGDLNALSSISGHVAIAAGGSGSVQGIEVAATGSNSGASPDTHSR
jgi:photosystem II stability/assembly factor-like uncharacterized protein